MGIGARGANRTIFKSQPQSQKKRESEKVMDEVSGLDFSMQGLKMLSLKCGMWTGLVSLCVSHNQLKEIPLEISKLTSLTLLDLSYNRIKKIPKEIGKLYNLKELRLGSNFISSVPAEFGMLYQIEKLDLDENPLIGQIGMVYNTSGGTGVIRYCRDNVSMSFPCWEREWVFFSKENAPQPGYNGMLSVVTYNILCPTYTGSQNFAYVPSWALQWETRKVTILQELISYNGDILCIQEMDTASYVDYFKENLKARGEYESVFYQKSRARTMSETEKRGVDGCAIFWKGGRFQMVEQRCIPLSQLFSQKTIGENEHIANRMLGRDNIALVVVLEREGGGHVVVANAHIHWDAEYCDVKTLQGIMLLKEVEGIVGRYAGADLVVCGDFNSQPSSSLYELMSSGHLPPYCKDLLGLSYEPYSSRGYTHSMDLKDSYSFVNMGFTNYTPGFMGVIDYIWYSERLLPVCSLGAVDEEYISKTVGLPTHHYPSDHLALVTQFRYKGGKKHNK